MKAKELGLSVVISSGERVVTYSGRPCTLVSREEELCEHDSPYKGEVLSSREIWKTPIGLVERAYRSWGAALENSSIEWRLVPVNQIAASQQRFEKAAKEYADAEAALRAITS